MPAGPHAVLLALMVLSSLLNQGLDGAPTVVLLGMVVISTASQLGLSPFPLMMGVGLAASAAFMTPFSHKANLLVMGAGGYRSMDYVEVGTPLTLVVLAILTLMIPVLMPFWVSRERGASRITRSRTRSRHGARFQEAVSRRPLEFKDYESEFWLIPNQVRRVFQL